MDADVRRAKTMTLWLSPEENNQSPGGEEAVAFAASCAGMDLETLRAMMVREGVDSLQVRVCHGIFFSRVVPTPEA